MTDYTNNYSLPFPEGGDRVAVHSDIEALAKRADTAFGGIFQGITSHLGALDSAVESGSFQRRTLTTDDRLDDLVSGTYWSPTTTVSEAVGLPSGMRGTLILTRSGANGNALFIKNGGSGPIQVLATERLSGAWSPWAQLGNDDALRSLIDTASFYQRALTTSDRLDNLRSGTYWASTTTIAEAVGLPAGVRGTLILSRSGGNGNALFISNGGGHEIRVYATDRLSNRWSPWTLVSSGGVIELTADDDLDSLATGTYWSNTTTISEAVGLPNGVRGTLQVSRTSSNGNALFISNGGNHPIRVYASERLSGAWSRWELISGGAGGGSAEVTELHAFLVAGQSNMSGHGTPYGDDMDPLHPRILQYGSRNRVIEPATVPLDQHNPTVGLSIATVFAREYLQDQPEHVGVLLIAAARGASYLKPRGAGDYTWYPGGAAAPEYDLYTQAVEQTHEALAADPRAELKGVLWHQGEGNNGDTEAEYVGYQDFMIQSFRDDLNRPDLPFMLGELTPEGMENFPGRKPVNTAISKTPARLERTAFSASERGWAKYEDETHYSRSGVEALGKRYRHAYHVALSNTADSDPTPPLEITARRTATSVIIRWVPPLCRVTAYQVDYREGDGAWQTLPRTNPMYPKEHLPSTATQVRVTTVHDQKVSTPVILEV